jgi:hypothetical protein
MMLDLVVVGLVIRLMVNAVKVGRQRQSSNSPPVAVWADPRPRSDAKTIVHGD